MGWLSKICLGYNLLNEADGSGPHLCGCCFDQSGIVLPITPLPGVGCKIERAPVTVVEARGQPQIRSLAVALAAVREPGNTSAWCADSI